MPCLVGTDIVGQVSGSYVREAWLNGLEMADGQGFDPFGFGVVASSDSHNASSGGYEDDYWVRFARTGNPNGGNVPEWPTFTAENEAYMELGPTIRAGNHLRIPQMELVARAWAERRAANAGGRD